MKRRVPESVSKAPPHSLVLVPTDAEVEFYVREDEFVLATYPQQCPVDFAVHAFDDGQVMCVAVLVQLAGRNAGTFDRLLNVAEPGGLRILQLLSTQKALNLYLVSERVFRSFRRRNTLAGQAAGLVAALRRRKAWSEEEYDRWRRRVDTLYPTPDALWRGARRKDR